MRKITAQVTGLECVTHYFEHLWSRGFKTFAKVLHSVDQRRLWSVKIDLKYLWKSIRLLHDWYSRGLISRALVYLTYIHIFQALVKITATKTPGKNFQAGKRMAHLFPNHHETLKRSELEDGKALEKVADRVVAESLENSRTNLCVNLMGLFIKMILLPYELKWKVNACFWSSFRLLSWK